MAPIKIIFFVLVGAFVYFMLAVFGLVPPL